MDWYWAIIGVSAGSDMRGGWRADSEESSGEGVAIVGENQRDFTILR